MILQIGGFNFESILTPILDFAVIMVFLFIMMYCYKNFRMFALIVLIFLINLLICLNSIGLNYNPFTPWIQICCILIHLVFLVQTSLNYNTEKKRVQ